MAPSQTPRVGGRSPWDTIQHVTPVGVVDGHAIVRVDTAGHGGYYVPRELHKHIPKAHRDYAARWSGSPSWYEEDCAWACVALAWPSLFPADAGEYARKIVAEYIERPTLAAV